MLTARFFQSQEASLKSQSLPVVESKAVRSEKFQNFLNTLLEETQKIFRKYEPTLTSQFWLKKWGNWAVDKLSTTLSKKYSKNIFASGDTEATKKIRIADIYEAIQTAINDPDPVTKLLTVIFEELYSDYAAILEHEKKNESKYGIAVIAIAQLIFNGISEEPQFKALIRPLHEQWAEIKAEEQHIKRNAGDPEKNISLCKKRNEVIQKLIQYRDLDALLYAFDNKEKFFDKTFNEPGEAFKPQGKHAVTNIYWSLPWIYQPSLPQLFSFRIESHQFPTDPKEWEDWKAKLQKDLEKKQEHAGRPTSGASDSAAPASVGAKSKDEFTEELGATVPLKLTTTGNNEEYKRASMTAKDVDEVDIVPVPEVAEFAERDEFADPELTPVPLSRQSASSSADIAGDEKSEAKAAQATTSTKAAGKNSNSKAGKKAAGAGAASLTTGAATFAGSAKSKKSQSGSDKSDSYSYGLGNN